MKNNKNKNPENEKNKNQTQNDAVNSIIAPFDLEKHSLDHERKPEDIGFNRKR